MAQKEKTSRPEGFKSKYARKRASGRQMYGPGCCAHSVTNEQVERRRREADKARRLERFDFLVRAAQDGGSRLSLNFPEGS